MSLAGVLGITTGLLFLAGAVSFFWGRWQLEREKASRAREVASLTKELTEAQASIKEYKLGVEKRDELLGVLQHSISQGEVSANVSRAEVDRLRAMVNKCVTPAGAADRVNAVLDRLKGLP